MPTSSACAGIGRSRSRYRSECWLVGTAEWQTLEEYVRVFLTIDKRIQHEQKIPYDVAIVTIRARSNRIQDLRPLVPELRRAIEESKPGKSTAVGRITRR